MRLFVMRILLISIALAAAAGIVVERTFTNTQIRTIDDVRSDVAGGTVAVRGTITYADENFFILDDGTGKAALSTCPVWYKRITLPRGEQVTVVGEAMRNPSLRSDCDVVLSVYKILRDDQVILVRRGPGKPPWIDRHATGNQGSM